MALDQSAEADIRTGRDEAVGAQEGERAARLLAREVCLPAGAEESIQSADRK